MTREEIKNKLYYVADTLKVNADKFAKGEALENENWIEAAKAFNACMNYLVQSHRNFEDVRKEEEPFEQQQLQN